MQMVIRTASRTAAIQGIRVGGNTPCALQTWRELSLCSLANQLNDQALVWQ